MKIKTIMGKQKIRDLRNKKNCQNFIYCQNRNVNS